MNSFYVALGSNLGDRRAHLQNCLELLEELGQLVKLSPIYETPALMPEGSGSSWNRPFFNMVIELKTALGPEALLRKTQDIEQNLGREREERWAPRSIDIDLLSWQGQEVKTDELTLPHPAIEERSFVLDPLKDLNGDFVKKARALPGHSPLWMGILNVTPDSFSDGGQLTNREKFKERVDHWRNTGVHVFDIGAESTRPNAETLSVQEEWDRLLLLNPLISVDTTKASVAHRAIQLGADIINDVSGGDDPEMLDVLKSSSVHYVLMHSLSVPADPKKVLSGDAMDELCRWLDEELNVLIRKGIDLSRFIFDPGLGFGKTPLQNIEIIKNLERFHHYPVRLMVGHSRKSFMRTFSSIEPKERDFETLGLSMRLIEKKVDIIRVHEPIAHIKTHRGWSHASCGTN